MLDQNSFDYNNKQKENIAMKEIYENFDKNKRIDCFITGCDFPNSSMSVYFQYLDEVYAEVELDDLVAISDGEKTFNDYFVELKKEYNRKKNREKSTTKLKQIYNEQLIVKSIVNKNIDKLSDVSFEYDTDLSVEFTEPINLELEKINLLLNDKVIGTIEINKNHKPPLQVVVCTMPKRHYYKLEAKALQFGLPFAYNPIQLLK
ncbi:hypothetical protein HMPREF3221_02024 [Fusobacterium nucleatum]|uniref:Uncharacterized protein n=2 Tax=Fusobacterium nucleatum TaxID=851 RepID=A0A133NJI6_FUSNU|nr:hypothetical protein HMPREF3221_02024 [Fusobacterium nucleatum]